MFSRERLVQRLREIRASLEITVADLGVDQDEPHIDHAAAISERESRELREIEHAIDLFDQGVYGICQQCGSPIGTARLKAIPHATFCIRCQAQNETGARRASCR
ncbi:MAG: hypothetical protein GTO41_04905 [Burkholderiales bacterium]|nr:hypothetical protein [Burkholderiales bacterium]